jgi:hypothetical protein
MISDMAKYAAADTDDVCNVFIGPFDEGTTADR